MQTRIMISQMQSQDLPTTMNNSKIKELQERQISTSQHSNQNLTLILVTLRQRDDKPKPGSTRL